MFYDMYNRPMGDSHSDSMMMNPEHESCFLNIKGYATDVLIHKNGKREVLWVDHPNIVVANASVVIAALIAGATGYAGAVIWAVGSGNSAWDATPVNPANTDSVLVAEVYRKAIPNGSIVFTDVNGNVVAGPTNNIQIQLTFGATEANFSLREFAIYGGTATTAAGSGLMINHKIHPVISKTNLLSLQRTLRMTF